MVWNIRGLAGKGKSMLSLTKISLKLMDMYQNDTDTRGSFIMTQILYFNPNEERMMRRLKKACPKTAGHSLKRLICLRRGYYQNDGKHEGAICGI
jgi:hypothetical protein